MSVNPFGAIPIYSSEFVQKYATKQSEKPHVYKTTQAVIDALPSGNQTVIISGESGAGKSDCAKFMLKYLTSVVGGDHWIEQRILEASTVLESFGNAKTIRNGNSSRFGKFIKVLFEKNEIVGAQVSSCQFFILDQPLFARKVTGCKSVCS